LPDVRSTEARSAGIDRPNGVIRAFQVSRNKVEPSECVLARNLFAKDHVRATLADEPEEIWPEVAVVCGAFALSSGRERLTGTTSGPDWSVVRPSCTAQGVAPDSNSSEEMTLGISQKVGWLNVSDTSLIHISVSNEFCCYQVPQPRGSERVEFVVVSLAHASPRSAIASKLDK
jgi:hypothetical protein